MLYLCVITIIVLYIYLFKKQKQILKYIPLTHKGIINLYKVINISSTYLSLYKLYFNIIVMFILIIFIAITLKLNSLFTITLIVINLSLIPLIIIWRLNYHRQEFEFNNLIVYLNQFIIVFKSFPKIYSTLIEIEDTISGKLNLLINNSIKEIEKGSSSQEALKEITKIYPHFIVYNLHTLVFTIEQYGTDDYFNALDLIQDDLDDWIEDIDMFNYSKNRIIQKVSILIIFALIICFVAIKMLFTTNVDANSTIYQISMFGFCLTLIFTYVISVSLLNLKWLERSEVLWS